MQLKPASENKQFATGVIVFALAVLLISLNFFQIYYISNPGDGDLLWNADAAYLFIHGEQRGYHVSYLGYLAEVVKEYFGVIPCTRAMPVPLCCAFRHLSLQ